VKHRNILHLGEGIVQKAFELGLIAKVVDLYRASEDAWAEVELENGAVGSARARKIVCAIDKSRDCSLAEFFGSLIPGYGVSVCEKLFDALSIKEIDDIGRLRVRSITAVEGFGEKKAKIFRSFYKKEKENIVELAAFMRFEKADSAPLQARGGVLAGKSVCFTGKSALKRSDLQSMVKKNGGEVKSSATKDLSILVCADPDSTSTKARAARANGTQLIDEGEFLRMIGWDGVI